MKNSSIYVFYDKLVQIGEPLFTFALSSSNISSTTPLLVTIFPLPMCLFLYFQKFTAPHFRSHHLLSNPSSLLTSLHFLSLPFTSSPFPYYPSPYFTLNLTFSLSSIPVLPLITIPLITFLFLHTLSFISLLFTNSTSPLLILPTLRTFTYYPSTSLFTHSTSLTTFILFLYYASSNFFYFLL